MKKTCPPKGSAISRIRASLWIAVATLAIVPAPARATSELDRQYAFQTIGFLRSWDNMDGLFSDYVSSAYRDFFGHQSRFVVQDLSKADVLLGKSAIPYHQVIEDREILGQLARSTRTETIIRTKIAKEGPRYRFIMDWLHAPKMDGLARAEFVLEEPGDGKPLAAGDIQGRIQKALDELLAKVPFHGNITGRDNNSVTINIGSGTGLKKGDALIISTLDEVKRHPLLKTVVDWRLTRTGKVEVDQIEEGLAFGHVIEEESGRQIARHQKITQILPLQAPRPSEAPVEHEETQPEIDEKPHLGFVIGQLGLGGFDRSFSSSVPGSTAALVGNGLAFGGRAEGELWFTKEWFADLRFGYGFAGYGQRDTVTGSLTTASASGGVSMATFNFRINAGYSYLVTGDFFGPKGWFKLGYQSTSYSLPISATELTGPMTFGSLFVGVGGDLPIRGPFGVQMDFNYGIIRSVTQTGFTVGDVASSHDVEFLLAGYYRYTSKLSVRFGFNLVAAGVDYSNGISATQKIITITPAILYYF